MMRLIVLMVFLNFSMVLISCSTPQATDSDGESVAGAIADTDLDVAAGKSTDGSAEVASDGANKAGSEDEMEKEIDQNNAENTAATSEASAAPKEQDSLEKELSEDDNKPATPPPATPVESAAVAPTPPSVSQPPPPAEPERAAVRDIRFLANSNGGTVVIETSKPVSYQTRMNPATQQYVIELADVDLPASLQRPYALKDFGSKFGGINAYQSAGSHTARVVLQLASSETGEPILQQEGTSLIVIPPAVSAAVPSAPLAKGQPAPKVDQTASGTALAAENLNEFLTGNQRFYGRPISLQVKDADVRDVINFIAEESGANIVMSDDVMGKISLKLRRVPWDQFLVTVMRSKGLGYVRQGNVLRISVLKTMQAETEMSKKIMETQKSIEPAIVQVIPVSYLALDDLLKEVAPFLTKETAGTGMGGRAVADNHTSTLIVTDKADVVARIVKLVKSLDIPPGQVSIESKIVEAIEGFENFVGVNWASVGSATQLSASGGAFGSPINLTQTTASASATQGFSSGQPFHTTINVAALDFFGDLNATLALAETDSLAKVISSPRISTMNREKSTIVQTSENVAVVTTRTDLTATATKTEKRTPYGLELTVTPQITSDGGVIMDLDVKRQFLGSVVDAELQSRPINTRQAHTKLLVRNGQTAVIGGIYTNDETEGTTGVPGLMNIPILGWLFKSRDITRSKNELLIFMTPRILAADMSTVPGTKTSLSEGTPPTGSAPTEDAAPSTVH